MAGSSEQTLDRAHGFNRRRFLGATAAMIAGGLTGVRSLAADSKAAALLPRYRIAVCDWMILKRQKLGAFQLAKDIGSPAIRSYFNFANALQAGRDLLAELRTLGRERICQIHCADEDGVWLENNRRLDLTAVKKVLDEMGWSGWLVIERSRDAKNPRDVKGNFGANARYLKKVFQQG